MASQRAIQNVAACMPWQQSPEQGAAATEPTTMPIKVPLDLTMLKLPSKKHRVPCHTRAFQRCG